MVRSAVKPADFDRKCIAVIADMVRSRDLGTGERTEAQGRFAEFVQKLNRNYKSALLSKFTITLGDEFQGLLIDSSVIANLMWDIETQYTSRVLRVGLGFGTLSTPPQEFAINVDGECLHHARQAIEIAKKEKLLGGVFSGFGEFETPVLNGFARLLWRHRNSLSPQQKKVVALLREGMAQTEAAKQMRLSKQAVSLYAKAAGWEAYAEGERGWKVALSHLVRFN